MKAVRVTVDARCITGSGGGVETVILGLAQGLAKLPTKDVEVTFLTYQGHDGWIAPYLSDNLHCLSDRLPRRSRALIRKTRVWAVRPSGRSFGVLPARDRRLDGLGSDVIHFPFQSARRVDRPFIYHPHDLQHRHLPEFFSPRLIAHRDVVYSDLCRRAAAIAVGTTWVKNDLVDQYGIDSEKILVIPLAPVSPFNQATANPLAPLPVGIPDRYVVYPAIPWPHKNHGTLIKALSILRARGLDVPLVLTGGGGEEDRSKLGQLANAEHVSDLVTDLGYLPQGQLDHVIAGATAMVVPTLFEAASFPIWEAFRQGVPVACSDVTSLPQQVGSAALVFNPRDPHSIASAVERLWTEPRLGKELAALGRDRLAQFSWEDTARKFLALYRRMAGLELSEEDRFHLESEPII